MTADLTAGSVAPAATFLEALTEHLDAIRERDIDRFAATLGRDDVRLVGGDGRIIEGRENAIDAHRGWFSGGEWTFDAELLWTRENEATALALTRVRYVENGDERQFLLLFVFAREDGAWKFLYDQNTPIAA